jgi:predicted nucleic acid-binding protein
LAIIADTGPLYALADADDSWHAPVKAFVGKNRESIIVPGPVVVEVCYLIFEHLGPAAELAFLQSLAARQMLLEQPVMKDLERTIEILKQYQDSEFGMVDATVMAMAERIGIHTVMTLDHRHFAVYRPRHTEAFNLVPSRVRR